jgi:hypothetical protein
MKKLLFLLVIGCMGATISCTKEVSTKEVSTDVSTNAAQSLQAVSQDNATAGGVGWGVWPHQSTTDKCIDVANTIGVNYVRTAIIVSDFKGNDSKLEQYVSKGLKPVVNLTWNRHGDWPKDMNQYKNTLQKVLDKYASKIEVAVIENEPTTELFHSGSIDDYITELKTAVSVCKQYNVKVTDGAIHIGNILLVKDGKINANKNTKKVSKLINAYRDLDLDYVNIHTAGFGNSYPLNDFTDCADYIRNKTGHPVMSNEWHTESNSSSLMSDMVKGWKAGGYKIAICNDGKYPLYHNGSLTSVGKDYKNDINN